MFNKIVVAFDNIIYNHEVQDNEDIEIILPSRAPSNLGQKSHVTKEHVIIMNSTVQIKARVYLNIKDYVPKFKIHCDDDKLATVEFSNYVGTSANSTCALTFATVNGGRKWLVSCTNFSYAEPTQIVQSVNGKSGSNVVLYASDIKMNDEGPTIVDEFKAINDKVDNMEQTIVSDVTGEVAKVLPDMIKLQFDDVEIVAEKV